MSYEFELGRKAGAGENAEGAAFLAGADGGDAEAAFSSFPNSVLVGFQPLPRRDRL